MRNPKQSVDEQRQLVRNVLRRRHAISPVLPTDIRTARPLSFAQERLWFLDRLVPEHAFYNVPLAYRLIGQLSVPALQAALDALVRRHEPLRTAYVGRDGRPAGMVHPASPVRLILHDLTGTHRTTLRETVADLASRPFDLHLGQPCRFDLLRVTADEHVFVATMHHIVVDDWSVAVFHRELSRLYSDHVVGRPTSLEPLPASFFQVVAAQRDQLTEAEIDRQLAYWTTQLAGFAGNVALPTDRPRPAVPSHRGGERSFSFPAELCAQVVALGRERGTTVFMTLLAALQALLARYSGTNDVAVGTPIAGRIGPAAEAVLGFMSNTLVMRTIASGNPTFADLLDRVRATAIDAYAHQELPFERLVSHLHPHRDVAHNPLFNVMFALNEAPDRGLDLAGLRARSEPVDRDVVKFDLWLGLHQAPDGELKGTLEYAADLFEPSTVDRMIGHLEVLLRAAVANPHIRLAGLPLLTEREISELSRWNATGTQYPQVTLHGLIEAQVRRTPDAPAVLSGSTELTYSRLDTLANRLANALTAAGAGPETIVAIALERSAELPVALLAALKTGAAYLPLDPAHPATRSRDLLDQTPPTVLLGRSATIDALGDGPWQTLRWDVFTDMPAIETGAATPVSIHPETAAYVLYTSGSTGRPKAVVNTHRSVTNRMQWVQEIHAIDGTDSVLQLTPTTFDVSLGELFWPLTAGARQLISPPGIQRDPRRLIEFIDQNSVTIVHLVPSVLRLFLAALSTDTRLCALRKVICNGETLPPDLAAAFHTALPHVELHNQYGPTEAAINVTEHHHRAGETLVPIGRPIANTEILILDQAGQPVPVGVPGEIYIAGPNLARGYHRPDLTAERFVPHPSAPGARAYRTGDMARWNPDGSIAILGRIDDQVKIRGHRVEPGEVAAKIRAHPSIVDAAVVASPGPSGTRLIAYVVPTLPDADALVEEKVDEWRQVWDDVHREPLRPGVEPDFSGWLSSYTGEPIGAAAMREWLDCTVSRLLAFAPRQVLELGCGVGLIAHRLAPQVSEYHGVDISANALRQLVRGISAGTGDRITVHNGPAHNLSHLDGRHFDLIILNSVAQYLPSAAHLTQVLNEALTRLSPGGVLFLGDLRNRDLLLHFHLSVEIGRSVADTPIAEVLRLARQRAATDRELVLSPTLFEQIPGLVGAEVQLRRGRHDTEMNRYRYDAILRTAPAVQPCAPTRWVTELPSIADLRNEPIGVRSLPDARIEEDDLALRLCLAASPSDTVADLQRRLAAVEKTGVHPDDLYQIGADAGSLVRVGWSDPGHLEVIYTRPATSPTDASGSPARPIRIDPALVASHANQPLRPRQERRLLTELRTYLSDALPDAMVPSVIVPVAALPLNASGKLDRTSLPTQDPWLATDPQHRRAPNGPVEIALAAIWRQVLGLDDIGSNDNYFDLGGDSIQGIQIVTRCAAAGFDVSPRMIFQYPTIAQLADALGSAEPVTVESASAASDLIGGLDQATADEFLADPAVADVYPMTPLQEGMLFECQTSTRVGLYIQQATWVVNGLNHEAFRAAWHKVIARHTALRTALRTGSAERPLQVVFKTVELPLSTSDWSDLPLDAQRAELDTLLASDRAAGFELDRPPLLRLRLIDLGRGDIRVIFTCHHMVLDGWSVALVLTEALHLLQGTQKKVRRSRPYRDFVAQLGDSAADRAFWRDHLAGMTELTALDLGGPDPTTPDSQTTVEIPIDPALVRRCLAFSRANRITSSVLVQGVWALMLARYTGRASAMFGVTVSGRSAIPDMENMVGLFVNTVPIRVRTPGSDRVGSWLRRLQEDQARRPEHTPLTVIRECTDIRGSSPLFDTVLSFDNYPMDPALRRSIANGIHEARIENRNGFPLTIGVDLGTNATIRILLDPARHSAAAVRTLAHRIHTFLESLVSDSDRRLDELSLLSAGELAAMPSNDVASGGLLHTVVAQHATATPDAVAVDCGGVVTTYRELDRAATRLAGALREQGCGTDQVIGLYLPRGEAYLTASLAVLMAGGAFLPLDRSQPAGRLKQLCHDAAVAMIVTDHGDLVDHIGLPVVRMDSHGLDPSAVNDAQDRADSVAYLIHTSGSTGKPKAVAVSHRAATVHMRAACAAYQLAAGDRVLQFSSPTFDIAVEQIYATWAAGATVVVMPVDTWTPAEFLASAAACGSTVANLPAAYWHQVVAEISDGGRVPSPLPLRMIVLGAEAVDVTMLKQWQSLLGTRIRILTGYGLTETVVTSTLTELGPQTGNRRPPVGTALPGRSVHILDPHQQPVPPGIVGQVYLGGTCLAREYWRSPALTADRFVPDHLGVVPGARLYRTGDLGRWCDDGQLELLGRIDRQLKVRGLRIEPAEIEAVLLQHPDIRAAVVIADADRLAGFVVTGHCDPVADGSLRAFVQDRLPPMLVPDVMVTMPEIPVTAHGKIDYAALAVASEVPDSGYQAPGTPLEKHVALVWTDVLAQERIGTADDFFDLGGHSLKAMRVVARLRRDLAMSIPIVLLLDHPRLADFCAAITELSE